MLAVNEWWHLVWHFSIKKFTHLFVFLRLLYSLDNSTNWLVNHLDHHWFNLDNHWINLHVDDRWIHLDDRWFSFISNHQVTDWNLPNSLTQLVRYQKHKNKPAGMHVWCRQQCTYGATSVVYLQTMCMLLEHHRMTKIAVLLDSVSFCTLVGLGFTAY